MKLEYKYKFSIVMAIYNVERYLEEAIESILQQDIGFEENVQLILVNDGSQDGSEEICRRYALDYPNNIIYVPKENGGVSSARNEGMKHIQGRYMNFCDSDDKLDKEVLRKVYDLFEQIHEYTDIVSIPIRFFDGQTGDHILNYKYKKTRQVNLLRDYNFIQLSASAAFIKSEYKEQFQFDENMRYAEDALFVNKILLQKETMGTVAGAYYRYRRRKDNSSAIQTSVKVKEWYTHYVKTFSKELIDYAFRTKGYVPKFIQYVVMYDLQWRLKLKEINRDVLDELECQEFIDSIAEVLKEIDNKIILEQRQLGIQYKLYALELKKQEDVNHHLKLIQSPHNIELMYENEYIYTLSETRIKIEFIDIKDGNLYIEGCIGKTLKHYPYKVYIDINEQLHLAEAVDRSINTEMSLGNIVRETLGFKANIPITEKNVQSVKVYVDVNGSLIRPQLILGKFVRINRELSDSYFITPTHRVMFKYNAFQLLKNSFKVNIGREYRVCKALFKKKDYKSILMRMCYFAYKKFSKTETWLLMDRVDKADDNAEHLFKYLMKEDNRAKKYFVIRKDSLDFERMKQYGKVIAYNSKTHKWLQLIADKVISSHIEDSIRVPFQGNGKTVRDLVSFKFIFLQHGITKDDVSGWLNKYNKNIDIFITSALAEYQSILEGHYEYTKDVVKLTGFPRYDGLINDTQKQILIMPTWRKAEVSEIDAKTGLRPYNTKFKESNYFKTYNKLLNNKKLHSACEKYGYKLIFFPHPAIHQQIEDFDKNEFVVFEDYNQSYQNMFNKSSLLITDYSSVAFDFAYLKKPVIYYQFDRDDFFKGHTYSEGYFDYGTMGFGPIYYEEEAIVDYIIESIEKECRLDSIYKERIETFYRYTDRNNCKRVYEEIKKI